MKMMSMSVFRHRAPAMPYVAMFLEGITANANQVTLESCAIPKSTNVWYPRVKMERLAKME